MTFKINEFISSVNRTEGLAKSSYFGVVINLPAKLINDKRLSDLQNIDGRHIALRVDSMEFPGRSTTNVPYRDYGMIRKIAYETNVVEVSMTVLLSQDFREKVFFELWQDLTSGNYRTNTQSADTTATENFSVGYYDDYVTNIGIVQYDEQGDPTYECTLIEAYPQLISPLSANWGNNDLHKLNIVWAYRFFSDRVLKSGYSAATINRGDWFKTSGVYAAGSVVAGSIIGSLGQRASTAIVGGISAAGLLRQSGLF